jgi:exosortase H (IPTLxxWG-CTERM-specific)
MSNPGPTPARMYRFLAYFCVCLLVGFILLFTPFTQPAVNGFSHGVVVIAAWLIRLFGGHAEAHADLMQNPYSPFGIRMANGCNGINVTVILWAAVIAFPASWKQKAKGLLAGTLAIHCVNLVRFISLYYLGQYNERWFEFAHMYLWESLMMLDTMVVFWTWAYFVRKPGPTAHAGAH